MQQLIYLCVTMLIVIEVSLVRDSTLLARARHLILVQPWKTGKFPNMTEKLLTGMLGIST